MSNKIACLPLETRRLLAASVVDLQLVIDGTAGNDVITVAFNSATSQIDVTLNGVSDGSFPPTDIFDIRINCLAGDDSVTISTGRRGIVYGGAGSDIIEGGFGADIVQGMAGDDMILDEFFGDGQPDTWSGGSGTDAFGFDGFPARPATIALDDLANDGFPGDANNNLMSDFEVIAGGLGNDLIDASTLSKGVTLRGFDGSDTLIGGSSADLLEGEANADSLVGNAGEDVLRGGGGNDTLSGGPGLDSFNAGFGNDVMNAADGEADVVNGAQGLGDSADIDDLLDTVIRVETIN